MIEVMKRWLFLLIPSLVRLSKNLQLVFSRLFVPHSLLYDRSHHPLFRHLIHPLSISPLPLLFDPVHQLDLSHLLRLALHDVSHSFLFGLLIESIKV